ncbi:hypothetical protein AMECASPLE_028351 [Ameca splendens]|uniref:Uncharacterized protein n=1 Tax=Ameca splendens TaxID=208324 RepID=A0ABV0YU14_9TELE
MEVAASLGYFDARGTVHLDAFLGRCSRHVPPGGGPGDGPGHAGGTVSLGWPGNALGSLKRAGGGVWGEGCLGVSTESAAPVLDEAEDNKYEGLVHFTKKMAS